MCGIAGLLHFDRDRPVDRALLDRMTDVLAHRGPDGRGTHVDGPLGLGHRRLSIIDLRPEAAQPMPNEDGSVWVVLNGEVYGFQALRDELLAKGHTFRSRSDTEVIVHLYEEEGDAVVERLRGMFAFALWDARRRRLLLARDRFGKKPLCYRLDERGVRFGSEIKAILEDPLVPRVPDPVALSDYLTYGYVPAPRTAFEGIRKLPPGHVLAVEADGRWSMRRYWSLPLAPKRLIRDAADEARAVDDVRAALDEATRLRLVADVPLGAFLSGGLDSSAVVASMVAAAPAGGVRTFSIGFDEPAWDEREHAERVARHLGTKHTALVLHPDATADLERIAWHHGEPFADASCLPTFAVSRLARQQVTVALSGDGGDELLLGYERYRGTHLEARLRGAPKPLRRLLRDRLFIHALWRTPPLRAVADALSHARSAAALSEEELYLTRIELLSPELKQLVLTDAALAASSPGERPRDARAVVLERIAASPGETTAERCAHADVETYLPDDILAKVDIASMAYGLETRCPLLDHVFAETVALLPVRMKMHRLKTKLALRRAVEPRLPPETLARRKQGFGVPLDRWFRGGLGPTLEAVLLDPRTLGRGLLREAGLRRLLAEHARGLDRQAPLFALLMLELWHRQWIDPPPGRLEPNPVRPAVTTA